MGTEQPYAAVVLAGGAGRRLGGPAKPSLPVGGRPMLHRVLDAVVDAAPRIVVGPPDLPLPPGVTRTQERPPGGGPVAATAAGLALVPAGRAYVALLAADLPLLTAGAVRDLHRAASAASTASGQEHPASTEGHASTAGGRGHPASAASPDGAIFVDDEGRRQWLCGVWRVAALRARLAALSEGPAGLPLRSLLGDLPAARVSVAGPGRLPWWDCDTTADLQRAEKELTHGDPG